MLEHFPKEHLRRFFGLAAIVRIAEGVRATCILRSAVVIDGSPSVIFRKELLDFPIALLRADAEFKIFLGNGVPVLEVM